MSYYRYQCKIAILCSLLKYCKKGLINKERERETKHSSYIQIKIKRFIQKLTEEFIY